MSDSLTGQESEIFAESKEDHVQHDILDGLSGINYVSFLNYF
jgi:hypothetical protein